MEAMMLVSLTPNGEMTMPYYLVEVRDSDGNDCRVYDYLVEAADKDAALNKVMDAAAAKYPDDEEDGGWGTYHACDCRCEHDGDGVCEDCSDSWECSHGGIVLNEEPEVYQTYEEAKNARACYHTFVDLTD